MVLAPSSYDKAKRLTIALWRVVGVRLSSRPVLKRLVTCILLLILGGPARVVAMQCPWGNKKPHELVAQCSVEPQQVERGSKERLQARIEATDSLGHDLA